jgi:hypothetical protein
MRQFTIAAAAAAVAGVVSVTPSLADYNPGGPVVQNGQCWKASKSTDQAFGHWRACAQPASGSATQLNNRRRA